MLYENIECDKRICGNAFVSFGMKYDLGQGYAKYVLMGLNNIMKLIPIN